MELNDNQRYFYRKTRIWSGIVVLLLSFSLLIIQLIFDGKVAVQKALYENNELIQTYENFTNLEFEAQTYDLKDGSEGVVYFTPERTMLLKGDVENLTNYYNLSINIENLNLALTILAILLFIFIVLCGFSIIMLV